METLSMRVAVLCLATLAWHTASAQLGNCSAVQPAAPTSGFGFVEARLTDSCTALC